MRKPFAPRPYQDIAFDFMLEHERCALWAGMGMGKTVSTYTLLDTLYLTGTESRPTLVLGPLRVARDTWPEEAQKWEHLRDIDVVNIGGTDKERRAAVAKDAAVYTTNYDQLIWLVENYGTPALWKWGTVVADESTRLKGFRMKQGGRRAQALSKVAHSFVKRWVNLTGTPAPNGLLDLWGQTWFLDKGQRLGLTYTAFQNRWFYRPPHDPDGEKRSKLKAHIFAEPQIYDALRDICLTLDPADWFDLQEPQTHTITVKMPAEAKRVYKEFEKTMFAELECGTELEVFNAAALTNKCLQIANGAVYLPKVGEDGQVIKGGYRVLHDAKLDALESIAEEWNGTPLLVAYQFVSDKERILKRFPTAALLSTKEGMKRFKAGLAPMGLAHPKSMGHGIDGLQNVVLEGLENTCHVLVRFGHDWNLEERQQMLERIGPVRQIQSGQNRIVQVYDLVSEQTVDEDVIERHISKRAVQDLLLDAMNRYKGIRTAA